VADFEEVRRVLARRSQLVQRRIDQTQAGLPVLGLVDLVGNRNEPCPLRAGERRPADVVPLGLVDVTAVTVRRSDR
jgi:hypothetical protein